MGLSVRICVYIWGGIRKVFGVPRFDACKQGYMYYRVEMKLFCYCRLFEFAIQKLIDSNIK